MKERIIYECEFCRSVNRPKRLMKKDRMQLHERICFYNPENKTCLTCAHNTREFMSKHIRFGYNVGCKGGAVTQEMVDNMSMSDLFRDFKCARYEFDLGKPPDVEEPWHPSPGEPGSGYEMGGSNAPGPWTEPF